MHLESGRRLQGRKMDLISPRVRIIIGVILAAVFVLASFSGCATVKIPDFKAHVTLPASGDGYWVKTVSTEEGRIPKEEWEKKIRHGVILLREDWAILRNTLLENCLSNSSCTTAVGTFDGLFYSLDEALKKVPGK